MKSQEQNVDDQRLLQKIQTLEGTINRHYAGIEETLKLEYQKSGKTVWEVLKGHSKSPQSAPNEALIAARAVLIQLAMFIKSLNFYLEHVTDLDNDPEIEHVVRLSYIEYLSPKILVLKKLIDLSELDEEKRDLLNTFTK